MYKDVIIVGAGAAGIGIAVTLKKMGIDYLILEKNEVATSFSKWPEGTRFISPSFTGNYFGFPDLNAVCPDTSPAYSLNTEHPTGEEFALYLKSIASFYSLEISEYTEVQSIKKDTDGFKIQTSNGLVESKFVIWAGGEYQFPKTRVCKGSEFAVHNTKIESLSKLEGEKFAILGGYESGFDTAIQLAKNGKKSVVFDSENHLMETRSDSSFSLSPYTKDRIIQYFDFIEVKSNTRINSIENEDGKYTVISEAGDKFEFDTKPILATGFETSLIQIKDKFNWDGGSPVLTEFDESDKIDGLFLVGPQVKHKNVIFCFIYKFRQRFPIVAKAIADRLGVGDTAPVVKTVKEYKDKNFYLEDLSCCENECVC